MALNPGSDPRPASLSAQRAAIGAEIAALWQTNAGGKNVPTLSNRPPQPPGQEHPGTSAELARSDHVHPGGGSSGDGTIACELEQLVCVNLSGTATPHGVLLSVSGSTYSGAPPGEDGVPIPMGAASYNYAGDPNFLDVAITVSGYYRNGTDRAFAVRVRHGVGYPIFLVYLPPTGSALGSFCHTYYAREYGTNGDTQYLVDLVLPT